MRQKEVDEEVKIRIMSGYPTKQIARDLHISKSSVYRVKRNLTHEEKEKKNIRPLDKGKIWALAHAGWSMDEILKECHCTPAEAEEAIKERLKAYYGKS